MQRVSHIELVCLPKCPSSIWAEQVFWLGKGNYGSDFVPTTKMGLFKVEDELRENIMSHFDERTSQEVQKRMYHLMKSRNNPIELDRK